MDSTPYDECFDNLFMPLQSHLKSLIWAISFDSKSDSQDLPGPIASGRFERGQSTNGHDQSQGQARVPGATGRLQNLLGRPIGMSSNGADLDEGLVVTGPLHDPNVTVLSPSAIGEATGKWILDTITLPFGWMIPDNKEKSPEQGPQQPPVPNGAPATSSSLSSQVQ